MSEPEKNRFSAPMRVEETQELPLERNTRFSELSWILILVGVGVGLVSLPLISNKYGNTDVYGLLLFPMSGVLIGIGGSIHSFGLWRSIMIGAAVGLVAAMLPFLLFWGYLFICVVLVSDLASLAA